MSKGMTLLAVVGTAVVGLIIGIELANWRFDGSRFIDPEVLLAARILVGGFGAILFGYAARSFVIKRAIRNS